MSPSFRSSTGLPLTVTLSPLISTVTLSWLSPFLVMMICSTSFLSVFTLSLSFSSCAWIATGAISRVATTTADSFKSLLFIAYLFKLFYVKFRTSNINTFSEIRNISEMLNSDSLPVVLLPDVWIGCHVSFMKQPVDIFFTHVLHPTFLQNFYRCNVCRQGPPDYLLKI